MPQRARWIQLAPKARGEVLCDFAARRSSTWRVNNPAATTIARITAKPKWNMRSPNVRHMPKNVPANITLWQYQNQSRNELPRTGKRQLGTLDRYMSRAQPPPKKATFVHSCKLPMSHLGNILHPNLGDLNPHKLFVVLGDAGRAPHGLCPSEATYPAVGCVL
jgi:hypothetical protein